jgi:hypothetical protein
MATREEMIMTATKDLLLKMLENPMAPLLKLSIRGGEEAAQDLGERFKILAKKVSEAYDAS